MTTSELLRSLHLFTTNDTRAVALSEFLLCGVFEQVIHSRNNATVPHEVRAPALEFVEGHVEFADDVIREGVEDLHINEEQNVDCELTEIPEELDIKREHAFLLPMSFHGCVDDEKGVAHDIRE